MFNASKQRDRVKSLTSDRENSHTSPTYLLACLLTFLTYLPTFNVTYLLTSLLSLLAYIHTFLLTCLHTYLLTYLLSLLSLLSLLTYLLSM